MDTEQGKKPTLRPDDDEQEQSNKKHHHEGSFSNYMSYKIQKLNEQFDKEQSTKTKISTIFQNISIYVNGLTNPSHSELKHLMALHGGRFNNYYSSKNITHIICTNLPDAKIKQYESERNPTPVVRPEWIVDSIAANTLLPINDYILWKLHLPRGQQTMFDLQTRAENIPHIPTTITATLDSLRQQQQQEISHNNTRTTPNKYQQDPKEIALAQQVASKLRSECDVLKGKPKSSKDDPNFVDSYYKASRLHFIGRWKARLESLVASPEALDGPMPTPWPKDEKNIGVVGGESRTIIHLDMDCFFASVAEAEHPEFKNKPLAVCHSNNVHGSGEISSANYEARKYGITAGMFISKAKELCPILIVTPYEFEKYEAVSETVFRILLRYSACVQPISCDEAYIDVTGLGDAKDIANMIRSDIFRETQCTASAGIGPNILLARIATKTAKPDGVCVVNNDVESIASYLSERDVSELPGVGYSTAKKLSELGIHCIADIHSKSTKCALQGAFGTRMGEMLWEYASGRDGRRVQMPSAAHTRKSVGAECNWGVRFESEQDPKTFISALSKQVSERMHQSNVCGKTITVKIKRMKKGWTEPSKFLGMGSVDTLSKSITMDTMTCDPAILFDSAMTVFKIMNVPFDEIRGLGISVTKLIHHQHHSGNGTSNNDVENGIHTNNNVAKAVNRPLDFFFTKKESEDKRVAEGEKGNMQDNIHIKETPLNDDGWETDSADHAQRDTLAPQEMHPSSVESKDARKRKRRDSFDGRGKQATIADMIQKQITSSDNGNNCYTMNTGGKIQALPLMADIDQSVLDALPLSLKRELEITYGIRQKIALLSTKRSTRSVASLSSKHAQRTLSEYPRIDRFVVQKTTTSRRQYMPLPSTVPVQKTRH